VAASAVPQCRNVTAMKRWVHSLTTGQFVVIAIVGVFAAYWFNQRANVWNSDYHLASTPIATLNEWRSNEATDQLISWISGAFTIWLAYTWFGKRPPKDSPS
jgi:hypothetical protein